MKTEPYLGIYCSDIPASSIIQYIDDQPTMALKTGQRHPRVLRRSRAACGEEVVVNIELCLGVGCSDVSASSLRSIKIRFARGEDVVVGAGGLKGLTPARV